MFNEHLLKKGLAPAEVEEIRIKQVSQDGWRYIQKFPTYTFACCPFCFKENVEHVNTYSLYLWRHKSAHEAAFFDRGIIYHCEHLVLVQSFRYNTTIHWNKKKPTFEKHFPYVAGLILEKGLAKAVIHALPICEWVDNEFVPRHAVFFFSYFSKQRKTALEEFSYHGASRFGHAAQSYAIPPRPEEQHWMDLPYWVERGLLYWVNPYAIEENYDPNNCLKTYDTASFPYGNLRALVYKE